MGPGRIGPSTRSVIRSTDDETLDDMWAAVIIIVVIFLIVWYLSYLNDHRKQNQTLPLPIGMYIPYLGCAPLVLLCPSTFFQDLAKKHGDVYTLYMMGRYMTVVNRLAFQPTFYRLEFYTALKDVELEEVMGPNSIVFRADDTMRLMRKRLTPRFMDNAANLEKEMHRALELEALHHTEVIDDIFPVFMRVLLCMNTKLFLGERMAHHPTLQALLADFYHRAKAVIWSPGPLGFLARKRCHQARERIVEVIKDEIIYLRTYPGWLENEDDVSQCFLQDMMRAYGDDPGWTDDLFAEKVFGILYATLANTPAVAVNTLMFILLDGDIRERVQVEVIVAHRIGGGRITQQAMSSLQLLGWCLEESIRLVSTPVQVRKTATATPIIGTDYIIPEARVVAVAVSIFHLDDQLFPDAYHFVPERFSDMPNALSAPNSPRSSRSDDSTPQTSPRMSHGALMSTLQGRRRSQAHDSKILSWGRGAHKCLGQELAYIEIRMLLAHLMHKYRVNLPADRDPVDPIDLVTTGVSMFRHRKVMFKSKLDLTMNLRDFQQYVLRRNTSQSKIRKETEPHTTESHTKTAESRPILRRTRTHTIESETGLRQTKTKANS